MKMHTALTVSARQYIWQGRGPIALMTLVALFCTSTSQAQETALPVQLASLTAAPTSSPVEAPTKRFAATDRPLQSLSASNVEMTIGGIILPLSKATTTIIEELTSETIAGAIIDVLGEDQIDSLFVDVNVTSPVTRKLRAQARKLAETKLTLDIVILIQSLIENHFMDRYIYGAFNDNNETAMFIDELKGSGDAALANVDSISMAPPTDGNDQGRTEDANSDTTNGNKDNAVTIAVPTLVIVVALGIGVASFFFFRRQSSTKGKKIHHESLAGTGSSPHSSSSDDSVEIQVNKDMGYEVSSLDDLSTVPEHQAVGATNIHGMIEEGNDSFLGYVLNDTENEVVRHKTINEAGKIEDDSSFGDYDTFKTRGNGSIKPQKTTSLVQPTTKPSVPEPIWDHNSSSDGERDFQRSFWAGANTSFISDTYGSTPTTLSFVTDDDALESHDFLEDEINSLPPGTSDTNDSAPTTLSFAIDDDLLDSQDFLDDEINSLPPGISDTNDSAPTTLLSVTHDDLLDSQDFLEDEINSFAVKVPPGLLGLVLIDSDQGVPAVHLVKDSSPLAGKVQTGDRLVSMDGKDVTLMSTTDISCLIAKKKNQSRRLLFTRPIKNQCTIPKMIRATTNSLKRAQGPRLLDSGTDLEYDSDKEYDA